MSGILGENGWLGSSSHDSRGSSTQGLFARFRELLSRTGHPGERTLFNASRYQDLNARGNEGSRPLGERRRAGRCGMIDRLYDTDDVPFGVREEESRLVRPVVVGLVAIVAVLLCIAIVSLLGGVVAPTFGTSGTSSSSDSNSFTVSDAETDTSEQLIYIHVIGCVASPGVYGVPKGARVIEAVQAAGGLTNEASQDDMNFARELTDGEQLRVLSHAEAAAAAEASASATASATSSSTGSTTGQAAGIDSSGKVNINTATSEELQTVTGIGPSIAQKIIDERNANGSFSSVDDLTRVSGIGDKKLAAFRDYLTV